jgi:peptide deformylase
MKNFTSKVLYYPDKRLLTKCEDIDFQIFDIIKLKSLFLEITKEIQSIKGFYQGNCIGMSANQLGYNYNIFVVSKFPKSETQKNKFFEMYINPEIVESSDNQVLKWEGCVSDKQNLLLLRRPEFITLKYFDIKGRMHIDKLPQAKSRIIQHEMDHLNGVDFYKTKIFDQVQIEVLDGDSTFLTQWIENELEREYLI